MLKIAVMSTKGGVGKTTLTASLAALFADMGLGVLLVDADVQPSLSKFYGIKHQAPKGLLEAVTSQNITKDCISETVINNLSIILSNDEMGMLQPWLMARVDNTERLSMALASPYIMEGHFDVCLIDTQGAVGPLQNNAALAANKILLPVVPDTLSARELSSGTLELIKRLEPTHTMRNRIGQINALFYKTDRTSDSRMVTEDLKTNFFTLEGRVSLLKTAIPNAVAYRDAARTRLPVHRMKHKGSESNNPWAIMHELAWELIPSLNGIYVTDETDDDAIESSSTVTKVST
jgi:chromosome partitioning related protein ParA